MENRFRDDSGFQQVQLHSEVLGQWFEVGGGNKHKEGRYLLDFRSFFIAENIMTYKYSGWD